MTPLPSHLKLSDIVKAAREALRAELPTGAGELSVQACIFRVCVRMLPRASATEIAAHADDVLAALKDRPGAGASRPQGSASVVSDHPRSIPPSRPSRPLSHAPNSDRSVRK